MRSSRSCGVSIVSTPPICILDCLVHDCRLRARLGGRVSTIQLFNIRFVETYTVTTANSYVSSYCRGLCQGSRTFYQVAITPTFTPQSRPPNGLYGLGTHTASLRFTCSDALTSPTLADLRVQATLALASLALLGSVGWAMFGVPISLFLVVSLCYSLASRGRRCRLLSRYIRQRYRCPSQALFSYDF